jgi:hypothetical protein
MNPKCGKSSEITPFAVVASKDGSIFRDGYYYTLDVEASSECSMGEQAMRFALAAALSLLTLAIMGVPVRMTYAYYQEKAEELPIGKTAQGQKLEYQSLTGKNLRIYRVRSTAMELKTEVHWKDPNETLLRANLPKCNNAREPCDWVTATIPSEKAKKGETTFGYGANGEQFNVKPDAFRRDAVQEDAKPLELTSSLVGTVADKEGNPIKVDVTVTSKVAVQKGEKTKFTYSIHVGGSDATALLLIKGDKAKKQPLLVWESAESGMYSKALADQKALKVSHLNDVTASFHADDFQVTRKLLKVVIGDTVIAATTAPAYTPKTKPKE